MSKLPNNITTEDYVVEREDGTRKRFGIHYREGEQTDTVVSTGTIIRHKENDRNIVTATFNLPESSGGHHVAQLGGGFLNTQRLNDDLKLALSKLHSDAFGTVSEPEWSDDNRQLKTYGIAASVVAVEALAHHKTISRELADTLEHDLAGRFAGTVHNLMEKLPALRNGGAPLPELVSAIDVVTEGGGTTIHRSTAAKPEIREGNRKRMTTYLRAHDRDGLEEVNAHIKYVFTHLTENEKMQMAMPDFIEKGESKNVAVAVRGLAASITALEVAAYNSDLDHDMVSEARNVAVKEFGQIFAEILAKNAERVASQSIQR